MMRRRVAPSRGVAWSTQYEVRELVLQGLSLPGPLFEQEKTWQGMDWSLWEVGGRREYAVRIETAVILSLLD